MKKSTTLIIVAAAVLVVAAAGAFFVTNNAKNDPVSTPVAEDSHAHDATTAHESTETETQGQEAEQTSKVAIENFAYTPATITVKKGTTVTWTNQDETKHDVNADGGTFKSELLAKGESFSFTFDEVGTFKYHCTPHPNMLGTVIVE